MLKSFIHIASAVLLSVGASSANAANFQECKRHFAKEREPVIQSTVLAGSRALCFDAFAILHSGKYKTPVYVAERLNRATLLDAQDEERTNKFYEEARLPKRERATLEDYRGSGFDRGHMAPAADMPNAQAMAQSFSLANMVPQAPENNRKSWKNIEQATRKYALRASGNVYVISGPVFMGSIRTIGPGQVAVPSHLFKLVYDEASNRAWAHWIENTDSAKPGKPISYEELVRRTGINFLPGVSPSQ